jgi:uncharacterized protein YjbI with pentapeptide repeats
MAQRFSHKNLQCRSFRGHNLAGEDFSYADIRGADFTNAILKGTNFSYAIAGLQRRQAAFLLGISFVATSLLGFASGFGGFFAAVLLKPENIKQYVIPGAIATIILAVLFIFVVRKGYADAKEAWGYKTNADKTVFASLASAAFATIVLTIAVILSFYGNTALVIALILFGGFSLIFAVFLALVIAGTLAVAGPSSVAVALAGILAVAGTLARVLVINDLLSVAEAIYLLVIGSVIIGIITNYIGWRSLVAYKFSWVRMIAINFAAFGGTSFRGADLTDANFTQAILKSTDFREANLTHTCFFNARKLDQTRYEQSGFLKLQHPSILKLFVTGNGRNESYIGLNLRGAYLVGADLSNADLTGADISEATLQGACLKGANLTQVQAIATDFSGAEFTGAYGLGTWNIDSTTKLDQVDCQYVYLLELPKPGTDDRERRPSSGYFEPGEFTKLFEEVFNTVDLIFRDGMNWKAFAYSYNKLLIENEGIELSLQSLEYKGDGVVVVRLNVPLDANKAKLHSDFTLYYSTLVKSLEERYQAELKGKDDEITFYRQQNQDIMKESFKLLASKNINEFPLTGKLFMRKLVVLKIVTGDLETGFTVILQIGEEGGMFYTEIPPVKLPPSTELPKLYSDWQSTYRSLGLNFGAIESEEQSEEEINNISPSEKLEQCRQAATNFKNTLNTWLNSPEFHPLKEKFMELQKTDEIRVLVQTDDIKLRQIPWHLWNIFDRYSKAEISLSALGYDKVDSSAFVIPRSKVRILAILGDTTGVDYKMDDVLTHLPKDVEVIPLEKPNRRQLYSSLNDPDGWDIIFFAGHSFSEPDGQTGGIRINQRDILRIEEFKNAFKTSIERGLQLAILNSCEGLGIANQLASLHIPQVILMREPVPDVVAQEFFNNFIKEFSSSGDKSLYLAVRAARGKLELIEDRYPCATWLPVIFQNQAEIPQNWSEFLGKKK